MSDLLNYQENLFSYQLDCYLVHETRHETREEGAGHEQGEGAAGLLEENEIHAGCSDLMLSDRRPEA